MSYLCSKLKKLRISKGESLQHVANAVGSSKAHIWQLETGKSDNPSLALLKNLAEFYGVSVSYLVGEKPGDDQEDSALIDLYRCLKNLDEGEINIVKDIIKGMKSRKNK